MMSSAEIPSAGLAPRLLPFIDLKAFVSGSLYLFLIRGLFSRITQKIVDRALCGQYQFFDRREGEKD